MDALAQLNRALTGRYEIEREIGRGGMATVYLARDLKHNRKVALKVLNPELGAVLGAERFLSEIRVTANLQHPNLLPLFDSGEAEGLLFYVMPYVEGESLRQRLDRERQLPVDAALQIAREIADALQHAHDHDIVHRDIKPENILLGSGHAIVMDFGIARAISRVSGDRLTETGIAIGTLAYMSPEQASGGEVDHRTDIYSLGCLLYEMLTGTPPYPGANPMAVMARKAAGAVPSLRVVRDTVPVVVERAVMKALAKVPADRFASARQFAAALAWDDAALLPAAEPVGARSRRRWLLLGAAGAVALIAGAYVLLAGTPWTARAAAPVAQFAQLTSAPGVEWFPSISADGTWIVYSGQQSGNRDVYLQRVGGEVPFNLTKDSPADDDQPALSPEGERIAFRSSRDGGGIFVMGRTGEGVRRVTTKGFRPAWSPDGTEIAFTTENVELNPGNSEGISELWIASVGTGTARKLNTGDAIQASWSPHGHRIAFSQRLGLPAQGDIYTIAPGGGELVPVTVDRARDWSPAWSADGKYLYFSSDRSGSMNLWRIAIDEQSGRPRGAPEPVTTPATYLAHPSIAATGHHIAYVSALVTINIQRMAFDPVSAKVVGEPRPVTTGTRSWSTPDLSPDGQSVAFYTLDQPEGDIYIARADGSGLRQVTSDTAIDRMPRWSPDGRWISFFSNRAGALNVWRIGADGSDLQRLTTVPSGYHAWSPDGRRMAAVIGMLTLRDSVIIIDFDSSPKPRIEPIPRSNIGPFILNAWSPDGERLVGQIGAVGGVGRGVAVYSFRTRSYEKLSDFGEWPVWLPDSRRILFVADQHSFWVVDSRTKETRKISSVDRDVIGPARLTADGRMMTFSRRVTEADVWLMTLK